MCHVTVKMVNIMRFSPSLDPVLRAWRREESGAVTVEFVILLPFMMGLLGLIAAASLYLALASDVQQLSYELARASLPEAQATDTEAECDDLGARWVPTLAANLPMLDADRVLDVTCQRDPANDLLQVTVNYDTRGTLAAILGGLIGMEFHSFRRSSFIRW